MAELTFETPGGYSTSVTEFSDGADDYFIRTDGSNTSGTFTNTQGFYYFTAQDNSTLPVTLLLNNINISGYTSLEFRVHLAEDDNGASQDWDNLDYVHFNSYIDNSNTFSSLLWIESTGSDTEPQIDTNFDGLGDGTAITDAFTQFKQNISGTGSLLDIEIVFRLNTGGDDIAIDNIEIWGTLAPCGTTVTWDGTSWDNTVGPDITTNAVINDDYSTNGSIGNFSACSLTINNSSELAIADYDYIEIQNDITVNTGSSISVQPYGAVVQNNDHGAFTNNGTTSVDKVTAPINAWYEYTYWSSPVVGETIEDAIDKSNPNRRFIFNAQNFLDATAESNNNDNTNTGQDDIDDNGNDWAWVNGSTVMEPGVGYATTITQFDYDIVPGTSNKTFRFTFEGDFNNGIISVPVYRNDSETNDNNWNLIGNPYPSAIDADLFLNANANVNENVTAGATTDGAIFLWSQSTPPSETTNGNQVLNFSDADYAIINGSGQIAGGDGVIPTRFIPSGQAFFISMSNTAPATLASGDVYTSEVVFSNSMRVFGTTDNSQFFKNKKSKKNISEVNKLWINLTSDNGVFNQTLVGYINGASNNDDGSYFDAQKNVSTTTSAILYTTIENSNKKFAIQGKASNSLSEDEVIKLGFKTSINVATLYTLSIDHLQGDFLTNNTIYLKDNLTDTVHNLSASDYTFTSEVGEFNERFEIAFINDVLSTDNNLLDTKSLKIVQLDNDNVQFSTSNNLSIKSVQLFDLLGRQLYNLKGNSSSETYKLSNLNEAVFIAKVELSNGTVITKKSVKN